MPPSCFQHALPAALLHELRIDVHCGDVIHHNAHLEPFLVLEHVLEERRLPGAEEAREECDGDGCLRLLPHRDLPAPQRRQRQRWALRREQASEDRRGQEAHG